LLAHAYANDREDELVEIRNCVGKEVSKHGRKKSGQRACGRRLVVPTTPYWTFTNAT
jgi:hypothetical protein